MKEISLVVFLCPKCLRKLFTRMVLLSVYKEVIHVLVPSEWFKRFLTQERRLILDEHLSTAFGKNKCIKEYILRYKILTNKLSS